MKLQINSEELKQIRTKLEMSQEAFGHMLGVSWSTINRWERGAFKPSRLAVEKINSLLTQYRVVP